MKVLPCGDAGLLIEVEDLAAVLRLHAALVAAPPAGVVDLVPAARTVLLVLDPQLVDRPSVVRDVERLAARVGTTGDDPALLPADDDQAVVQLPVVYDGADLDEVGALTGLGRGGVIEAHTGQVWTVAFCGFAPGFGYLVGADERLHVPRRASPRTRVPAGSVALAGDFTGVYPREAPGGWQLIGRTSTPTWDLTREPPALLTPGARVRFVEG